MSFRLVLQPGVAMIFAIRARIRDFRNARPLFLWSYFTDSAGRRELVDKGWNDIKRVFIFAVVLDSIYQVMVHAAIYALELVVTVSVLAVFPYVLLRSLIPCLAHVAGMTRSERQGTTNEPQELIGKKGDGTQ